LGAYDKWDKLRFMYICPNFTGKFIGKLFFFASLFYRGFLDEIKKVCVYVFSWLPLYIFVFRVFFPYSSNKPGHFSISYLNGLLRAWFCPPKLASKVQRDVPYYVDSWIEDKSILMMMFNGNLHACGIGWLYSLI
jgi:hypothetical protein